MINSSLSFHNDTCWSLEHDRRTSKKYPKNVNPEDSKYNVYWKGNMTLEEFYNKYFEPAHREYQQQQRGDRRTNETYLETLSRKADEKEKIVRDMESAHAPYTEIAKVNKYTKIAYSTVITIGNCKDNPEFKHGGAREEDAKAILSEYMNTFEERNPGFKLVCGAIHCDEGDRYDADGDLEKVGGNIHLHLIYVPVAECSRGQRVQNSLTQALKNMGIYSDKTKDPITGKYQTAQIKWQYRERDFLTKLCKEYDINIIDAGKGSEKHLAVDDYQRKQEIDYVNQKAKQNAEKEELLEIREQNIREILEENPTVAEIEGILNENVEVSQRNDELEQRENNTQDFIHSIRESYFTESSLLWERRNKEKEALKKLIKEASANKKLDEARYKKIMNSVYNTNEKLIVRLFKYIYSLFFRYKLKREEEQLQAMVELNKKMKEKSKEIVVAGRNLTNTLKEKKLNEVLEALEKWDYTVSTIESDISHIIDVDMESEKLKRRAYEERLARKELQGNSGGGRTNEHYYDDDER